MAKVCSNDPTPLDSLLRICITEADNNQAIIRLGATRKRFTE
jgi:hypothetical protein